MLHQTEGVAIGACFKSGCIISVHQRLTACPGHSPGSVVVDLDIEAEHQTYIAAEEAADRLLRQLEVYLSGAQSAQDPPSRRFPATDITVQRE